MNATGGNGCRGMTVSLPTAGDTLSVLPRQGACSMQLHPHWSIPRQGEDLPRNLQPSGLGPLSVFAFVPTSTSFHLQALWERWRKKKGLALDVSFFALLSLFYVTQTCLVDQHILGMKVRSQETPEWQKAEVVSWSWWSIRNFPLMIKQPTASKQYIYPSTISHITLLFKHQLRTITAWKFRDEIKNYRIAQFGH